MRADVFFWAAVALLLFVAEVLAPGAAMLWLALAGPLTAVPLLLFVWMLTRVPAPGGPEPFYRSFGFEPTGEIDEGEVVARLRL